MVDVLSLLFTLLVSAPAGQPAAGPPVPLSAETQPFIRPLWPPLGG